MLTGDPAPTMTVVLDDENRLSYRRTPWDASSLGVETREILALRYTEVDRARRLLERYEAIAELDGVVLTYTRVDAEDRPLVLVYQQSGYSFVEASYQVGASLGAFRPPGNLRKPLHLRAAVATDRAQMMSLGETAFRYGRFLEDVRVDRAATRLRQRNWVADLFVQGKPALVYESGGQILAMMFYEQQDGVAKLILGGGAAGMGLLSVYFWVAVLDRLASEGARRAETVISAANLGVVNLYAMLGFKFEKLLVGLHKHREVRPDRDAQDPG